LESLWIVREHFGLKRMFLLAPIFPRILLAGRKGLRLYADKNRHRDDKNFHDTRSSAHHLDAEGAEVSLRELYLKFE
jgi:hypothetical protein